MKFYKYTPALLDPKTLEDTLIGRDLELDNLKRILKSASSGKSFSHAILIGPKGIGKTHILRILYHAVRGEIRTKDIDAFKNKYIPVIFSEEEYPGSITKLLILTLHYLSESKPEGIPPIPTELMDAVTLGSKEKEIALSYIRDFRKKTGRILLLLVDNLNDIIERFTDEDQSALREVLISYDSILLVGAAPTLFDSIVDHNKPFYNFFEIIWLRDLSFEDAVALLKRYAELENRNDLMQALIEKEGKLRAIHELAGGNPRLILSLYHIIVEGDITSVENTFLKLLDELSPYFRERMKDLSEQQKEIIDTMARADGLLTPTELARRCQMPVNLVNSQLRRLEKVGYVQIARKHSKKAFYDFNERLFSFWRQMRVDAGRRRLGFIVHFLEIWYSEDDLLNLFWETYENFKKHLYTHDRTEFDNFFNNLWYINDAIPEIKKVGHKLLTKLEILRSECSNFVDTFRNKSEIDKKDKRLLNEFLWALIGSFLSVETEKNTYWPRHWAKRAADTMDKATCKKSFIEALVIHLKVLVGSRTITLSKYLLQEVAKLDQADVRESLTPYLTLTKYLDTKDPEIIDRLRHEERIVVEDMLRMLGEKTEEKPINKKRRNGKRGIPDLPTGQADKRE